MDPFDALVAHARRRPFVGVTLGIAAVLGLALGIQTLAYHLLNDPLADVEAYYRAGQRLNAGLPLYPPGADVDAPDFYRYPPLLAMLFRPLALLPYSAAAGLWEAVILVALAATLWRLGIRRPTTWIAVAILARPIAWTLSIGQAQALVTLLLAIGSPWSVAVATHLKLFPVIVAVWWVSRREWLQVARLGGWIVALAAVQVVIDPANSVAFLGTLNLEQVGEVANISPFAISPALWLALVLVGSLAAVRLAPTRWGWAAAVGLSVLAMPRLLIYMFSSLLAALTPRRPVIGPPASPGREE